MTLLQLCFCAAVALAVAECRQLRVHHGGRSGQQWPAWMGGRRDRAGVNKWRRWLMYFLLSAAAAVLCSAAAAACAGHFYNLSALTSANGTSVLGHSSDEYWINVCGGIPSIPACTDAALCMDFA